MKTYHLAHKEADHNHQRTGWYCELEKQYGAHVICFHRIKTTCLYLATKMLRRQSDHLGINISLRIHLKNGRIQEERTYGEDPIASKG